MTPYELILKKRSGKSHTREEIQTLIASYTRGEVPDYQMAAWLMAVYFQGMNTMERMELVRAMIDSGQRLDFSHLDGYVADKHSTGGVGDKVSLILAPIVAACGVYVPMLSGRSLGHTGGTLDKLDSIPGFKTSLDLPAFKKTVADIGLCLIGQTDEICPADKKMYALRDVTATVESVPLICGSIMSKKIAEGIQGLVLDVKCGNGAFMHTYREARDLATALVETGAEFGVRTRARLTDMNQPLGHYAGIWCEVQESLSVLEGGGPEDLVSLSKTLSADILSLAGHEAPGAAIESAISSGAARAKFDEMVHAQGGDVKSLTHPGTNKPAHLIPMAAPRSGYLEAVDTFACGMSLITAGAGRIRKKDRLDPTAGFYFTLNIGDHVRAGDEIGSYFGSDKSKLERALDQFYATLSWSESPPERQNLLLGEIGES